MALSVCHDFEFWSALRNQRLAGPVREQPHRVLGEKRSSRLTPPRPAGRPRSRPPARTLISQRAFRVVVRSWVHAREPVKRPALGVGDRQDEYVPLVLFESDHVGEPLDGRLTYQLACG